MAEYEVESDKYKKAKKEDILKSGGTGPCICVGAIDKKCQYLAHIVSFKDISTPLDNLLNDLKKDVKDKSKLKIIVVGGSEYDTLSPEEENKELKDSILENRIRIIKRLKKEKFEKQIKKIEWAKPDTVSELILNSKHKNGYYIEESNLYDKEDWRNQHP